MKLRLKGNSIRVRLNRRDIERRSTRDGSTTPSGSGRDSRSRTPWRWASPDVGKLALVERQRLVWRRDVHSHPCPIAEASNRCSRVGITVRR